MKGIEYLILRVSLVFVFWLVTMPVVWIAVLLMNYISHHEAYKELKWVLLPVLLMWLFGIPWFAHKTAEYMAFQGFKFKQARQAAFCDVRLRLAFLPVIGHWFAPKNDDKADDHDL